MQTSSPAEKGFTLIEIMVAILIVMVGLMGLLQSVDLLAETNLKNHLRDEAVLVGEQEMNNLMVARFDTMLDSYASLSVPSKMRGVNKNYRVERTAAMVPNTNSRELNVRVVWKYKNTSTSHLVSAIRSNGQ